MADTSRRTPAEIRTLRGGLLSQLGNLRRVRDTYDRRAAAALRELAANNLDDAGIAAALARCGAYNDASADLTTIITAIERQSS